MQRWDYKMVCECAEWHVDGNPAPEFAKLDVPDVLKRLGQEGWELVCVNDSGQYFLKRPLE